MNEELTLPESLILLAMNDEAGTLEGVFVEYALAGAGLAELVIRQILQETEEPPARFVLASSAPTGDAFLDGCLAIIHEKGVGRPPKKLIHAIAANKGLKKQLLDRLVVRGILRARTKKILFFFEQTIYPQAMPEPERALKARLAEIMFGDGPVAPRDGVLITLAKQTDLLRRNFDKALLKTHKQRIDDIAGGKMLATTATVETIKAVQAAIMVAVIIPVVT